MPNTNYSLCLTSCDRHELLKTTLESYFAIVDQEPQETLIYEDSDKPMPEWLKSDVWRGRNVRWLSGKTRMGQCFAIAQLIREAKYEYVMWGEDDWLFQRQIYPIIRESKAILDAHPEIIQVSLRGETGWHPLVKVEKYPFKIAQPYWRGEWGGWSWNPGLRRRSTLLRILPHVLSNVGVKGLKHEGDLSKHLLDQNYRIADLGKPIVTHIGGNRSRAVEDLPPLPKILIAIPTCFQFRYDTHELHNPERFHVNGANEQTQACRETWVSDFLPFHNVTAKFFYGKPADGYPRQPLSDEVFLEVPDGYDSLIQKTTAVCKWATEHDFEFLFKCDTDTWVYAERLLIEMMENAFDYAGYRHANVCSGGPGYFLSREAMRIIAERGQAPRHDYAEDVHVSRVLAEAGVIPIMLPNHNSGHSAHFFFGDPDTFDPNRLTPEIVTAHAVFPQQMRAWHEHNKVQ